MESNTTRRTTVAALPPNLLIEIIKKTLRRRSPYDFQARKILTRLARVNKTWLEAARRVLYSHVYLGNPEDVTETTRLFLRTIRASSSLASYVQAIHHGSMRFARTETADLADAITLCDNINHINLRGWNGFELENLRNAVMSRTSLQSIEIFRHGLNDMECDLFCDLPHFFLMLQSWPNLQSVLVHNNTIGRDDSDFDDVPPVTFDVTAGACSQLKRFDLRCGILEDRHMVALSQMAPSLSELMLNSSVLAATKHGLAAALQAWSSKMTELTLSFYLSEDGGGGSQLKDDLRIDSVITQMFALRYLEVSSAYIEPASLAQGFPNLAKFRYKMYSEELAGFIAVLRQKDSLPSLRALYVRARDSTVPFDPVTYSTLKEVCHQRGIELRDNYFIEMEEMERWMMDYSADEDSVDVHEGNSEDEDGSFDEEDGSFEDDDDTSEDDE